ncbi:putative nucleotide-diphospho-sugar transferase [Lacinutrix undariae]
MNTTQGFLYVANRPKFLEEALLSVRSLRRFNTAPIGLVCSPELKTPAIEAAFDVVITDEHLVTYTYMAKVVGMQLTPFERTIFLDCDTFITDTIMELFEVLDIADFASTVEEKIHTHRGLAKAYIDVIPEFNTGVMVYKNNTIMIKVLEEWLSICVSSNILIDMPGFREVVLNNFKDIHYVILPQAYNTHGFSTMLMLFTKVKVIHERLGYKWGYITPYFGSFEKMDAFAKRINKKTCKRLYIPKIGIIPYNWSPDNVILYIKKKLKFKRVSKSY